MYGEVKLAFFIYLWYPKTKVKTEDDWMRTGRNFVRQVQQIITLNSCSMQGTGFIYETMLRPFVTRHETDIERKLQEMKARGWDFAIYYWHNCTELGQTKFFDALQYFMSQSGKSTNSKTKVNYFSFKTSH
jgi:receptor expression-enhancing protein 1/2/3/4